MRSQIGLPSSVTLGERTEIGRLCRREGAYHDGLCERGGRRLPSGAPLESGHILILYYSLSYYY